MHPAIMFLFTMDETNSFLIIQIEALFAYFAKTRPAV